MGKAEIISESGAGLYTVEVRHDRTAADALLSRLTASLASVEARIAEEAAPQALVALELRRVSIEKRIDAVTAASDADYQAPAWCADLTEGLAGEVGTIEPGAESKNGINIRPGYDDAAAFDAARDGQATPFLTMGVADAMRNFAIMPAIQKWRPTYRYGTVSNVDYTENTCRVVLDPLFSSIQGLDINHESTYDNVPISYMSCNATAFEDGDSVIVKCDPYDVSGQPTVIGFKDHPKSCGIHLKLNSINGIAFPVGPSSYQLRLTQPIAQSIDHWAKGTYTEDYTVIGSGSVDDAGVVEIQVEPGVTIDPDFPLHVGIKNHTKWTYWTTDWRGSVPDRGFKWSPADGDEDGWYTYPTDDPGNYDFCLDMVQWMLTDIDLRTEDETQFQNAAGHTAKGYEVEIGGVKVLRRDHCRYFVTDMVCQISGSDPPDSLTDALDRDRPVNFLDHEYDLVPGVPRNFDYDDWEAHFYTLARPLSCPDDVANHTCFGGETGEAHKYYTPVDPLAESSPVGTKEDPGILANRNGQNLQYTQSQSAIEIENDYLCTWLYNQTLGGWHCVNWITGAVVWLADKCGAGEAVNTGEYCFPEMLYCTQAMAELGELMLYEMIDLSSDEI